jgi:hypothetical protein
VGNEDGWLEYISDSSQQRKSLEAHQICQMEIGQYGSNADPDPH